MEKSIQNFDLLNIVIIENIWTKPIVLEQILSAVDAIYTGSIVIYLWGNTIEQLLPISNFESKPDIIQYLKLKIPDVLPCQWSSLKLEQTIQTINEYKHLECFKEKDIILIN